MKWLVLCVLMCLARGGEFGAYFKKQRNNDVQSSLMSDDDLESPENGPECLAGSKWTSRCNQCHCTVKGKKVCTKNVCEAHNNEPEKHCAPNTYWKNDCNSCFCTDTGVAGCTQVGCIHFDIQTTQNNTTTKPENLVEGKECAIGTSWKDDCYQCVCTREGFPSCTELNCSTKSEKKRKCAADSNWRDECNTCWCQDGDPVCTRIGCNGPTADLLFDDDKADKNNKIEHKITKRETCKPNLTFRKDCNFCKCSNDGLTYHCTENECMDTLDKDVEVFMESEGKDHIERHAVCEPRMYFKIECNSCVCNYDGSDYSCTKKLCPVPDDVELFHEYTDLRIVKKCKPGEVLEMECNMCICNVDGESYSCTRRACYTESPTTMEDYNLLKNQSIKTLRRKRGTQTTQESPKACTPGQEFRMDCNTCLCDNEGQDFSCTRIDCNNNNNKPSSRRRREVSSVDNKCSPGSVFERDCNVCRCSNDGLHATCTLHRCDKSLDHDKHDDNEENNNFRCNPGEQFKRNCNDCTCSADGKSVFCTVHFCDDDIKVNS